MNEYILFMHDDVVDRSIVDDSARWEQYIASLRASGQFEGGSSIGSGVLCKKGRANQDATPAINGYIKLQAENIDAAQRFLTGNPVYEAGGTVEVRELVRG